MARVQALASGFRLRRSGFWILLTVFSLTLLGMIVLFSASQAMDTGGVSVFKKQLAWLVVAIVTGCVAAMVPLEYLRNKRLIMPISVLTVLALILVLV